MNEISQYSIKYRPHYFKDVYGQDSIVKALKKRVINNDFPKAILLKGPFGTGKTTLAHIIAAAFQSHDEEGEPNWNNPSNKSILNETFDRDTVVLDGSMFSGKTDMVEFTRGLKTRPLMDSRKIYIIEEIDQVSGAAMNSLLKILEDKTPWVHFILLSMNDKKGVSNAIQSRCQVFNVQPVSVKDTMYALKHILELEGLWQDENIPQSFKLEGLSTIATASKGSMRNACQFLEKCLINEAYKKEDIEALLTVVDETSTWRVLDNLLEKTKEETVWKFVMDSDAMELYNYMTLLLSEAILCKETGFVYPGASYDRLSTMGNNPNAERLYYCLTLHPQMNKPFLRTADLIGALDCYYQGMDFRPNKEISVTRTREVPVKEETTTPQVRVRMRG